MRVEARGADRVYFLGFTPGGTPDPERDGRVSAAPVTHPDDAPDLWAQSAMSNGGPIDAIYAVAENQHGRAVSPVLFVAWNREGSGYSEQDLKHP